MGTGPGQIVDETDWNYISDRTYEKPIGRMSRTTAHALADNTYTAINCHDEDFDTHNFHDISTNPSRVTPTVPGYYTFRGSAIFEGQSTPVFSDFHFRKNGSSQLPGGGRLPGQASAFGGVAFATVSMNGSTDYIEFVLRQDSAGSDNTNGTSPFIVVVEWEFVRNL